MNSEWKYTPLGDVCSRITYGFTNPMPTINGDGAYMITAKDIKNGRIQYQTARKTSWDAYREKLTDKSRPVKGDLLLTKDGSIGRLALCDRDDICINQSVALLQSNGKGNFRYIKYLLEAPEYQRQMEADSDGSTIKHIYITRVDKMMIPLPPRKEQEGIVSVLGTIDDKIELNRKTNETLEAMAKAIFKSWFVDFDPVRAKAEGRPTGLPAEISDLFPDSFEDSELGEIPTGWQCSPLADQSIYISRGISPAYCEEGGVLVLNQKCIRDSRVSFEKARRHDPKKKQIIGRKVRRFDALVNSTGVGTLGRVAMMPICPEEVVVDSHVTVVRGSNDKESFFISSTLLNRQTEIEALGEGSTGQTELSRVVLGSVPVTFPSSQLIFAYFDSAYTIQDKIEKNDQASVALASTRDTLLPKLISGEIRIPDAEKMLKEVGV